MTEKPSGTIEEADTERVAILAGFNPQSHARSLDSLIDALLGRGQVDYAVLRRLDGQPVTAEHIDAALGMTEADYTKLKRLRTQQPKGAAAQ